MIEPRVTYYVAEERTGSPGKERGPRVRDFQPFPTASSAEAEAEYFNQEEEELARLEQRRVKVLYVVVKATTTYEKVPN